MNADSMSALKPQTVDNSRSSSKLYTGLPVATGSTSFWMGQARDGNIWGIQSVLLKEADLVIIGSGYTGAATAYWLLTGPNPPKSIVMLEAREVCSGATGRNGGFCRPDCYRGYSSYKKLFGKEQAMKIIEQEMENLDLTEQVIKKENIECDWHRFTTLDIAMDQRCKKEMDVLLKEYIDDGGHNASIIKYCDDPLAIQKVTRAIGGLASTEVPCASLWPYKLVCGMLAICMSKGLSLQSNTPALSIKEQDTGSLLVETPRGHICAGKVLHASNAFAPTLLPEFEGYLCPVRGQASRVVPPVSYSGKNMLKNAPMFRMAEKSTDYDYFNQRPADGNIICGGGRITIPIEEMVGQTDDSDYEERTQVYVRTIGKKYLSGWGEEGIGEGLVQSWSGIMSYTHSMLPFVGPIPNRPNQFMACGHSGHGMARIMSIARGMAKLISGATWQDTNLPECFQPTRDRLQQSMSVQEEFWAGKKGWTIQPSKL